MKRTLLLLLLSASLLAGCVKPDVSACSEPNLYAWSLLAGPMYSQTIATMKAASGEQQDPAAYAQVMQNLDAEIAALQERREDAAFIGTPACLEPSRTALVEALDLSIAALEALRAGEKDAFYTHSMAAAQRITESMQLSQDIFDAIE